RLLGITKTAHWVLTRYLITERSYPVDKIMVAKQGNSHAAQAPDALSERLTLRTDGQGLHRHRLDNENASACRERSSPVGGRLTQSKRARGDPTAFRTARRPRNARCDRWRVGVYLRADPPDPTKCTAQPEEASHSIVSKPKTRRGAFHYNKD